MHFDESLFEDFQNNTKAKIKQCSYQARNIEMGWFLRNSENETYNEAQTTVILRQKADYFYAQCDYGKALKYYEKLLQSISATNKMLCYEVKESVIRCLRKMNKNTEVLKIIDEMSEDNKMDSLWLLLFNIHKDKSNTKGAIFTLQCCLEHHEEVADYWIKLARSYNHLSTCFKLDDLCMVGSACCLNDNQKADYEKDLSLDWYGRQQHDPKDTWVVTPTATTKSTTYTTKSASTATTKSATTATTGKSTTDTTKSTTKSATTATTGKSTTDTIKSTTKSTTATTKSATTYTTKSATTATTGKSTTDTTKSTTDTTKSTTDTTKSTTDTTKSATTATTKSATTATTGKSTTATTKSATTATTGKSTTATTKATKDTTKPTTATTKPTTTTKQISEMTLDNKEVTGAMEKKHAMLQPNCTTSVALSPEQTNLDEVKHYVQEHYYCFCTLCSLIIARFLIHKYSFHSSALQSKKENENFLKVISMIKSISCASVDIIKDTERLVNEKFAISSVSRCTPAHSNATDKSTGILAQDEMIQRIKDFERQWFPFL